MIGLLAILFLQPTPWTESESEVSKSAFEILHNLFKIFIDPDMILFTISFSYMGLGLSFWQGVYGTCLGRTKLFENSKSLVGFHGIAMGCGEISGGLIFGIFGKYLNRFIGRSPRYLLGIIAHMGAYLIAFLNIPFDCPIGETNESAIIESNADLAIFGSFLLGSGDSILTTQIYTLIGILYSGNSAPAFAIYKFFQSGLAALGLFYSPSLELQWQLLILLIFAVIGTISFIMVDINSKKRTKGHQFNKVTNKESENHVSS